MGSPIGANRLLHVYSGEIIESEELVSDAYARLLEYCAFDRPPASLIHRCIRRILIDSGSISFIFFPADRRSDRAKRRSEYLRQELKISDGSLLQNRVLRNHMAHLDERLDKWAMDSTQKTFGRGMIGSRADAHQVGISSEDLLGLFDPKTMIYSFLEDDLCIDDLVEEVRLISHRARSFVRKTPWDERLQ